MDQEQRQEVFRLLPWAAFYQVLHSVCTTANSRRTSGNRFVFRSHSFRLGLLDG
jgi:hypothetical protein